MKAPDLYSEELGIHLESGREPEVFKWFLASLLFGKPIQEEVAKRTWRVFEASGVLDPDAILRTGWDGLVKILDAGGYVRYDFSTATKLLRIMKQLKEEYRGRITNVHAAAADARDLERRLAEFHGVGPVTVNIFLRELRTVWRKADPEPLPAVLEVARRLRVRLPRRRRTKAFVRLEAGLLRRRKAISAE